MVLNSYIMHFPSVNSCVVVTSEKFVFFLVCMFFMIHMQNPRKEVNAVLNKEASYFGDIVILPFMDRYELVVLKTIAICEYGVRLSSSGLFL